MREASTSRRSADAHECYGFRYNDRHESGKPHGCSGTRQSTFSSGIHFATSLTSPLPLRNLPQVTCVEGCAAPLPAGSRYSVSIVPHDSRGNPALAGLTPGTPDALAALDGWSLELAGDPDAPITKDLVTESHMLVLEATVRVATTDAASGRPLAGQGAIVRVGNATVHTASIVVIPGLCGQSKDRYTPRRAVATS